MADRKFILIGEVVKPHGLRGEICVEYYADSPFLFDELRRVYIEARGKKPRKFDIESWRMHQGRVLLKVRGIDGRDQAETWRRATVHAKFADLPPIEDDEVYLFELEGIEVRLADGSRLGVIQRVDFSPQELWVIVTDDGKEVLFPVHEDFVTEIDTDEGYVVIAPPEGLLELYLDE